MSALPLYLQRTTILPSEFLVAYGAQSSDSAIPAYYSIKEGAQYMASAFAPRAYAISQVGNATRFEVHQGDRNFADEATHTDCDRCELMHREDMLVKTGDTFALNFSVMFEPGSPNTAAWFLFCQFHQDIYTSKLAGSPPIAFELLGETMRVLTRYGTNGLDGTTGNTKIVQWTDTAPIVRGQTYQFTLKGMFHPTAGNLIITKDGLEVVRYAGPLGFTTMAGAYLAHGLYRATSPEVMASQQYIQSFSVGSVSFA